MKDLYAVLELVKGCSDGDIRKAYRKLSKELHPDRNPGDADAEARYKEVQSAYAVLADPARRKLYDETGEDGEVAARLLNVQRVLGQILPQVFGAVIESGRTVTRENLVKHCLKVAAVRRDEVQGNRLKAEKMLTELRKSLERFQVCKEEVDRAEEEPAAFFAANGKSVTAVAKTKRQYTPDDGPNICRQVVEDLIAGLDAECASALITLEALDETVRYLKRCRYEHEPDPLAIWGFGGIMTTGELRHSFK